MAEKRRHHVTSNTSTITFRPPSGRALVLLVHGRPSEVRSKIQTAMDRKQASMTFWDLNQARNVKVNLNEYDTWSVK